MNLVFSLVILLLLSSCCEKCKTDSNIMSQRYVHKYGFDLSKREWDKRNQEGQVVTCYQNGITKTENYRFGILDGNCTFSYPFSNNIQKLEEYKDGELLRYVLYDTAGIPTKEEVFTITGGKSITVWDTNGIPLLSEEYDENGKLLSGKYNSPENELETFIQESSGVRLKRNRDGILIAKERIENGQTIEKITYHVNGQIQSVCYFNNHSLHGPQKVFSSEGHIVLEANWEYGSLDGVKTFYNEGKKYLEVPYVAGKKHGIEKEFDKNEKLTREVTWENDLRHGRSSAYLDNRVSTKWYWKGEIVKLDKYEKLDFRRELAAKLDIR